MVSPQVLVVGCGYAGSAAARLARARGQRVIATVRSEQRAAALRAEGIEVVAQPTLDATWLARQLHETTHVIAAFPPDGETDARIAPALGRAASIAYVSSTGVYGEHEGLVDDRTALPSAPDARAERLLDAERCYNQLGACVLRCPGIYGPDRGLHVRVLRGEHRIVADGSRYLSRIHVADLAELLLRCGEHADVRGQTFVVGDLVPAPQIEVVRFVCETYGVALPAAVPLEAAPVSLRANRQVDPSRALQTLSVSLRYPSYRQGMAPAATGIPVRSMLAPP